MCVLCSCVCCFVILSVQMMEVSKEEYENMCEDDSDNKVNALSACLFIITPLDNDTATDVIPDDVRLVSVSLHVAQLL